MDGYKAYKYYLALKLHFSKDSYDIFSTRGSVKYSREQFDKRNDKMLYEAFSKKYPNDKDMIQFLVSNIAYGNESPIYDMDESTKFYNDWIKRKESITKVISDDLTIIINDAERNSYKKESVLDFTFNQQPSILSLYLGKRISLETVSILDEFIDLFSLWKQSGFIMTCWESEIRRIHKAIKFIKYDVDRIRPLVNHFNEELNEL